MRDKAFFLIMTEPTRIGRSSKRNECHKSSARKIQIKIQGTICPCLHVPAETIRNQNTQTEKAFFGASSKMMSQRAKGSLPGYLWRFIFRIAFLKGRSRGKTY